MKHDLTQGHIGRNLIRFFLPIAAGTIFQQLYNAVDGIIVGKFVGTIALAAVGGSAAIIMNVLIGFFVALSGGCTVVIAQLFGAGDEEGTVKVLDEDALWLPDCCSREEGPCPGMEHPTMVVQSSTSNLPS